jgi:hypothetical protein
MKKHTAPVLAAILLLLPVLYVGSYFVLVVPRGRMPKSTAVASMFASPGGIIKPTHYRVYPSLSAKFFWPLEQIDRKVRPGAWPRRLADPYENSTY